MIVNGDSERLTRSVNSRVNKQYSKQRNFQAATAGEVYASWSSTSITPDELVHKSLKILRARSRDLKNSNDMAVSFIRLCQNHIVGHKGFRFTGKAREHLGGELDKTANLALQSAWKTWNRDGYCDFNGKHDGAAFDRLLVDTVATDGETFIQELPGPMHGIAFRMYDPETVPIEYNVARGKNQNLVRFGIEYDQYDRPVAYYFRDREGAAYNLGYQAGNLKLKRILAKDIQHVYVQDRIGLRRGFPWMSASMVRFKMIGRFEDAAIQNAVVGASKVGIISGSGSDDIIDEIEENGTRIMETEHLGLYQTDGEVSFDTFDTTFPSTEYGPFVKTNTMFLAAGVGVNYHSLSGDLSGVNYSSLKHGTTEERETWKVLQEWLIVDWKRPQYRRWLKMALLVGIKVTEKGNLRPQNYDKYSEFEFSGRRWIGPDPLKEASAESMKIRENTTSVQRVVAANGEDYDELMEEIAEHHEKMRDAGIPVTVAPNVINIDMSEENGKNAESS